MFLDCTSSSIRFTGRFAHLGNTMTATANGSSVEIAFKGEEMLLNFELGGRRQPYPHLWISVDSGAWIEAPLDWYLRIKAASGGEHIAKIVMKSSIEAQERWYAPLSSKVSFVGAEVEEAGKLPEDNRRTIELVGDSITEGVLIDPSLTPFANETDCRVYQDDVFATYGYITAQNLNLKAYHVGYGAVGFTHAGQGSVPAVNYSYDYCFSGAPVEYSHPDYILINHGTNDRYADVNKYISEYEAFLKHLTELHPNSEIIVLTGFSGVFPRETAEMVSRFNKENGTDVFFIDSTGWVPAEPIHPLRDGHKTVAKQLTAALKERYGL